MKNRTTSYKSGIFFFCVFAVVWAICLLYAGAYTTSIQAGMAFLDWPLSNSSINPDGWLTNEEMRAEHSHRLLGASLGLMSIILIFLTQMREQRRWVRNLALAFFAVVLSQGLLGGFRVLFDQLNTGAEHNLVGQTFCVLHAAGAQLVVAILITLTIATSRFWFKVAHNNNSPISPSIRTWGILATVTLFLQIIVGAVMRHTGAGLAIPTFPLTPEGSLLPSLWNFQVTTHWLHRLGAVIATVAILVFTGKLFGDANARRHTAWIASFVLLILAFQIFLGAATIWTHKNPIMASTHMLVGAILFASTWMLTFITFRLPIQAASTKKLRETQTKADLGQRPSAHPIG